MIILLAAEEGGSVRLYADPVSMLQVSEQDRGYIEELVGDLADRSKAAPKEVFRQLSSLSSGPLVTDAVRALGGGSVEESYPGFQLYQN